MGNNNIIKGLGNGIAKTLFYAGKLTYVTTVFILGNLWKGGKQASLQIRKKMIEKELKENKP